MFYMRAYRPDTHTPFNLTPPQKLPTRTHPRENESVENEFIYFVCACMNIAAISYMYI